MPTTASQDRKDLSWVALPFFQWGNPCDAMARVEGRCTIFVVPSPRPPMLDRVFTDHVRKLVPDRRWENQVVDEATGEQGRRATSGWPERLWIVRHGQSAGNVARDYAESSGAPLIELEHRDADVPLSALGE